MTWMPGHALAWLGTDAYARTGRDGVRRVARPNMTMCSRYSLMYTDLVSKGFPRLVLRAGFAMNCRGKIALPSPRVAMSGKHDRGFLARATRSVLPCGNNRDGHS